MSADLTNYSFGEIRPFNGPMTNAYLKNIPGFEHGQGKYRLIGNNCQDYVSAVRGTNW